MYVSSRQGYKPPVKSTGRGKEYRKGVKENHQRIADYLQKTCGLCIDFPKQKIIVNKRIKRRNKAT